jgi:integrase
LSETKSSGRMFGNHPPGRTSPLCPSCDPPKVWKDGLRGEVQRWLCRSCGFRFSGSKVLNVDSAITEERQICVSKAKNLAALEKYRASAGTPVKDEVRALVKVFRSWLEKEGYAKGTHYPNNLLRLARAGADLKDPESIKAAIGRLEIKNGTKLQYIYGYDAFAKMMKISWEPPWYKQEEAIPFVPDESELDCLIATCHSKRMAAYLQCLKDIYADPGEALRIEWKDVSGNVVTINHPVKGHLPRQLEVHNKLIAMLNALPRESELIFPIKYSSLFSCYDHVRRRAAELQKNPRLLQVELRSFRHWGGTMLAYYSHGNVLFVKRMLGHKYVENTMKYIHMIHFKEDEFEIATATTPEEIQALGKAGWSKYDEMVFSGVQIHFYRKPKRFGNLEDKLDLPTINLK